MINLEILECQKDAINEVVEVINKAYRGELSSKAWTTEADLLGGKRAEKELIEEILNQENSKFYIAKFEKKIVGNIQVKLESSDIYIGLFSVHPDFQSSGIGKKLLKFAEDNSSILYKKANKFKMQVITLREDLIEFYKRRGYKVTNSFFEFPKSELWNIKIEDELNFVILEKDILR